MNANPAWTPPSTVLTLVRATRGPVLLIILGGLFAFDHFDKMPFERTWPILIIVLGLWKLLEHLAARGSSQQYAAPPPYPPPPYAPPPPEPPAPGGPAHA